MRKFLSPDDAGYGLNPRFLEAFNFVDQKIRNGELKFSVPYIYQQYVVEINTSLRDSGWKLTESQEQNEITSTGKTVWEIKKI